MEKLKTIISIICLFTMAIEWSLEYIWIAFIAAGILLTITLTINKGVTYENSNQRIYDRRRHNRRPLYQDEL